jgi:hypothetical protein
MFKKYSSTIIGGCKMGVIRMNLIVGALFSIIIGPKFNNNLSQI